MLSINVAVIFYFLIKQKKQFFSTFSYFPSNLISQELLGTNIAKSTILWLIQAEHYFYRKINNTEVFSFLISITLAFLSITIWYPVVVYHCIIHMATIKGNSRSKLSPAFGSCLQWFVFKMPVERYHEHRDGLGAICRFFW